MLSVAVLTARPDGNAARIAHLLLRVPEAPFRIVAFVVDTGEKTSLRRRLGRLAAWRRHGGVGYVAWRLALQVHDRIRLPSRTTYARDIESLGAEFGVPVWYVPSINSGAARDALRASGADVGLSIENRLIERGTFEVPRLGVLNLHHGEIPHYRGFPPAFWEIHDGADRMGVTVHRIEERLDAGEIVAQELVPVWPGDDPCTLYARSLEVDARLVAQALRELATGEVTSTPVELNGSRVNSIPSPLAVWRARRRAGRPLRSDGYLTAPLAEVPTARMPDATSVAAAER